MEQLEGYELLRDAQRDKLAGRNHLECIWFICKYKMGEETFRQVTHVIDCGSGLKYLFTFTTSHSEMTSEGTFQYMLEHSWFKTVKELAWHCFDCANCRIEYPQLWTRQCTGSTLFFFSPIQLVSHNKVTDNVVAQYITNGMTIEHDVKQLFRQLSDKKCFRVIRDISEDAVAGFDAKYFHVHYEHNGKQLSQITYLIKVHSSENTKWMVSYTSVLDAPSKTLFDEMLRRMTFKNINKS